MKIRFHLMKSIVKSLESKRNAEKVWKENDSDYVFNEWKDESSNHTHASTHASKHAFIVHIDCRAFFQLKVRWKRKQCKIHFNSNFESFSRCKKEWMHINSLVYMVNAIITFPLIFFLLFRVLFVFFCIEHYKANAMEIMECTKHHNRMVLIWKRKLLIGAAFFYSSLIFYTFCVWIFVRNIRNSIRKCIWKKRATFNFIHLKFMKWCQLAV